MAKKGFTLIEILVTVTIIATLAAISINGYSKAKSQSRDTKRITDITSINAAIGLYHYDKKSYPPSIANNWSTGTLGMPGWNVDTNWAIGLSPDYIAVLPVDPYPDIDPAVTRGYAYRSNGTSYKIMAHQPENCNAISDSSVLDPVRDGGPDTAKVETGYNCWAWAYYSAGTGASW